MDFRLVFAKLTFPRSFRFVSCINLIKSPQKVFGQVRKLGRFKRTNQIFYR